MSSSLTSGERETKERRKEEGREQRKKQQPPATSFCRKCMGKSINLEHRLKKTTDESDGGVLRL